jgi:Protein of unknown function (DUF1554)
MSAGNTVATMPLMGGLCTNAQVFTVTVDPTSILDTVGNSGTGTPAIRTYTVSTGAPTVSIGTPSATRISAGSPVLTMAFTYTASAAGGTALTGSLTTGGGGITVATVTGTPTCTISVQSISPSGGTILLSSCSGNGTFTVHVNAATVKDALNVNSTVSSESALITVDNIVPTVSNTNPAASTIYSIPSSIIVNFSEVVTAVSGNFGFSGTCTAPTLSSIGGSGTATVTLNLSGGNCTNGQTLILTSTLSGISDLAGNVGSGTNTVTFTYAVPKRIYITHLVSGGTNGTSNGNIGGISAADTICNTDSNKPNSSTYKALIVDDAGTRVACTSANCVTSGASEHAGTWPLAPNAAYVRADGTTAIGTTTSAGIFSFDLTNSISTLLSNSYALTGLNQDWTTKTGYTCANWTDSSSSSRMQTGRLASADANAIAYADFNCAQQRYLYCVEQ